MMRTFDVIVVGAGAAGLMCAIAAGKRRRRVLVIERSAVPGRKILISGGGRCNFTNIHTSADNFISSNPHFSKSVLCRFTPDEFIAMVDAHGIAWHEKKLGQLFCDGSSRQILDMLLSEAAKAGVRIQMECAIAEIRRNGHFELETSQGAFSCSSLVVATGGVSIPKAGATDFGYRVARQFGLRIIEPRPALVPLVWSAEDATRFGDLSGISVPCVAATGGARFEENLLFTHRGLSGPAILQVSSYWKPGQRIEIDLTPQAEHVVFSGSASESRVRSELRRLLPGRMGEKWSTLFVPAKPLLARADLDSIRHALTNWTVTPAGTEGFAKAEVTAGGVDTSGLTSKTMEARSVPGLFFIGEVVDVTGHLGGFNFQWAWSSGVVAGESV